MCGTKVSFLICCTIFMFDPPADILSQLPALIPSGSSDVGAYCLTHHC